MKSGTQLGPYRVESKIGAGGMGEVYLAIDTRLDRNVAIKILPAQHSANAALRERFEREAKTISSLSHPNICALYDVGSHDGSDYLVMEYLQGETLAERLTKGALPREQVIRIGIDIANALDRAHKQGIVHRDLKPGNIMLTKSGVKLLDFGLAKLNVIGRRDQDAPTSLLTAQKPLTEQGQIVGTFQYMSPEQLEGRDLDARSDIFSFGAVLYEMTTGRRAFDGKSKASLIAAILDREPQPMSEIQPLTPPALERVVRACLAKDPDERIQTAHDVALELKWMAESSSAFERAVLPQKKAARAWIAASLFALVAIAATAMYLRERAKPQTAFALSIAPLGNEDFDYPEISPDGKSVAYLRREDGQASVMLRHLDDPQPLKLATIGSTTVRPFWSSDSKWIAFGTSKRDLMRIPATGGTPELICNTAMASLGSWNAKGTVIFTPNWGAGGIVKVPASGGAPTPVTTLDKSRDEAGHMCPRFLSDGDHFVFMIHTRGGNRNDIAVASLSGMKPRPIVSADALVGYSKPYLLFSRGGAIYAQHFDETSFTLSGEPQRIVNDSFYFEGAASTYASVSADGTLVYVPYIASRVRIGWYDRNGAAQSIIWRDEDAGGFQISDDLRQATIAKFNPEKGAPDIYALDLSRGISSRLTADHGTDNSPTMTRDGQQVFFASDRGRMFDVFMKSTDGSTPERLIWSDDFDKYPVSLSADSRYLLVQRVSPDTRSDIWVLPLIEGEKPHPFIATDSSEDQAKFSPDGTWVAYRSNATARDEVFIKPFAGGRAVRVSLDGGESPSWNPNGKELSFIKDGTKVMVAAIETHGTTADVGAPKLLFEMPEMTAFARFGPNGNFLIATTVPGYSSKNAITVMSGWKSKLH